MIQDEEETTLAGKFLLLFWMIAAFLIILELAGVHIIHGIGNIIRWLGWA